MNGMECGGTVAETDGLDEICIFGFHRWGHRYVTRARTDRDPWEQEGKDGGGQS